MASKIQLRRDSSGNWSATNPILAEGEMGVELDTNRSKLGDGTSNWNDIDYMTDTNAVGTYDASYLIKNRNVGDQTVVSTGTTTFNGLVEADRGVKITGGNPLSETGITGDTNVLSFYCDGERTIRVRNSGNSGLISTQEFDKERIDAGFTSIQSTLNIGDCGTNNVVGARSQINLTNTRAGDITFFESLSTGTYATEEDGTTPVVNNCIGYRAGGAINKGKNNYGFLSAIKTIDDDSNRVAFNFYAQASAPSFFQGNTYIGGGVARNTRELWESTLNEEQKEQLAAGTLAIPANVSTPGDGSFVRQWWYSQQSAENQALIDSGELDYPGDFQAANFADTFDLGDNTNIDLLASGQIFYRDKITQGLYTDFKQVGRPEANAALAFTSTKRFGTGIGLRSINDVNSAAGLDSNCPRIVLNRCTSSTAIDDGTKTVDTTNIVPCENDARIGEINFATSEANTDTYLCRFTAYKRDRGGELELYLDNTATGGDVAYYFDPDGKFGYRDNNTDVFYIDAERDSSEEGEPNNSQTLLRVNTASLRINPEYFTNITNRVNLGADKGDTTIPLTVSISQGTAGLRKDLNFGGYSLAEGTAAATAAAGLWLERGGIFFDWADDTSVTLGHWEDGTGADDPKEFIRDVIVDNDGEVTIPNQGFISLRMEEDDPAAFQTTYSTDEEGNQVEKQTYIGSRENLLDIIKDLRARITELESGSGGGGSELESRLATLEADMARIKAI